MIPINGRKLALVNSKPSRNLRYKTVSYNNWWLIKTDKESEEQTYSSEELAIIRGFIVNLWARGYRKSMEQLVRATKDKRLIEGFYKSTSLEQFRNIPLTERSETVNSIPEDLYQSRRYSVYHLCKDIVGSEITVIPEISGKYNHVSLDDELTEAPKKEWVRVRSIKTNSKRANISLYLGEGYGSRCIIKDGQLNVRYIGIRGELPKGIKKKAVDMTLVGDDEYVLDLSKLPITSRADFKGKRTLRELAIAQARFEYAKRCKYRIPKQDKKKAELIKKDKVDHYEYEAMTLSPIIKITGKIIRDEKKDWAKEYDEARETRNQLIFQLLSQKIHRFHQKGRPTLVSNKQEVRIGETLISVSWEFKKEVIKV